MSNAARTLGIAACCLFLVALALPAAEVTIAGYPELVLGWEAAVTSLLMFKPLMFDVRSSILVLAAIGNIVFVIAPWMVLKRRRGPASRAYVFVVLLAFLLAAASAYPLHPIAVLHGGYFVWMAAHASLLGAAVMRVRTAL